MTPTQEIAFAGGAIAASDWIREGFHRRPVPRGCREVYRCEIHRLPDRARQAAERLLTSRPRVRKLIVLIEPN